MLPRRLAVALLLGGLAGTGCRVPEPTPADWQAVGFRTPEQAFHTFRTAIAADQSDLEYRSFSSGFKRRGLGDGAVTQLGWRLFKAELEREQPWFRHVARAEIESSEPLDEGRHRIVAVVGFLWNEWRFELDLVREDFYELWSLGELADDDAARFDELVRVAEAVSGGGKDLEVTVPLNDWVEPGELDEVRVGREWKIDSFRLLEDAEPDPHP